MKFIIHKHTDHNNEEDHFDFMLETEDSLLTWRINKLDISLLDKPGELVTLKLKNHRKEYLSFEGPISCNRGFVEIYDQGNYSIINENQENYKIKLSGEKLTSTIIIKELSVGSYMFTVL